MIEENLGFDLFANDFADQLATAIARLQNKCRKVEADLKKGHKLLRQVIGERTVRAYGRNWLRYPGICGYMYTSRTCNSEMHAMQTCNSMGNMCLSFQYDRYAHKCYIDRFKNFDIKRTDCGSQVLFIKDHDWD